MRLSSRSFHVVIVIDSDLVGRHILPGALEPPVDGEQLRPRVALDLLALLGRRAHVPNDGVVGELGVGEALEERKSVEMPFEPGKD